MSYVEKICENINKDMMQVGADLCCKWLLQDMRKFLDFYNLNFLRFGSYINDMYKLAVLADVEFCKCKDLDDYKKFYCQFKEFYTYKVNQYLEFKEMEVDGKIRK